MPPGPGTVGPRVAARWESQASQRLGAGRWRAHLSPLVVGRGRGVNCQLKQVQAYVCCYRVGNMDCLNLIPTLVDSFEVLCALEQNYPVVSCCKASFRDT